MKSYKLTFKTLAIALFSLALVSCSLDGGDKELEPGAYFTVAKAIKSDDKSFIYFQEDDSTTLLPTNTLSWPDSLIGKRYYTEFYLLKPSYSNPYFDKTIRMYYVEPVLEKSVFPIETKEESDSLGNDVARPRFIWMTGRYVNMVYDVWGAGTKPHYINVVKNNYDGNPDFPTTDSLRLEFRHNQNGQPSVNVYSGVVSFDVTSIIPEGRTEKMIVRLGYKDFANAYQVVRIEIDPKKVLGLVEDEEKVSYRRAQPFQNQGRAKFE